ncbi:hypothetical protein SELMODRAFT_404596 [Selaginella moellendorffii]|uniref:DOG1 domain-containing protein n=1 Tax=Selaginella moellendorffii TaxID=88036 RepID=D8QVU3_SELML|nr:hypothetical protein SELMODRAFT_404596 [Selaginella moellendorffii]
MKLEIAEGIFPRLETTTTVRKRYQRPSNSPRSSKPTSASITSVNSTEIYYSRQKAASDRNLELDSNANTNWDNPCMADTSPLTDNSTDVEPSPKAGKSAIVSTVHDTNKNADTKTLRRLAQNREAARKSRLRKKGFYFGGSSSDQNGGNTNNTNAANSGALAFDMDYARWMEEHQRQVSELRSGLQAHMADNELRVLVDGFMSHYDELFRLKGVAAKADVFHLVSGMWKTPAERCFMWMGGFRPSELLKILIPQLEPLTEQQLLGICNLQQSSQQAEDALSQGMEALQQSLADTLAAGSLGNSPNVANYMGQMAMAMGKLGTLENFVRQDSNHETSRSGAPCDGGLLREAASSKFSMVGAAQGVKYLDRKEKFFAGSINKEIAKVFTIFRFCTVEPAIRCSLRLWIHIHNFTSRTGAVSVRKWPACKRTLSVHARHASKEYLLALGGGNGAVQFPRISKNAKNYALSSVLHGKVLSSLFLFPYSMYRGSSSKVHERIVHSQDIKHPRLFFRNVYEARDVLCAMKMISKQTSIGRHKVNVKSYRGWHPDGTMASLATIWMLQQAIDENKSHGVLHLDKTATMKICLLLGEEVICLMATSKCGWEEGGGLRSQRTAALLDLVSSLLSLEPSAVGTEVETLKSRGKIVSTVHDTNRNADSMTLRKLAKPRLVNDQNGGNNNNTNAGNWCLAFDMRDGWKNTKGKLASSEPACKHTFTLRRTFDSTARAQQLLGTCSRHSRPSQGWTLSRKGWKLDTLVAGLSRKLPQRSELHETNGHGDGKA